MHSIPSAGDNVLMLFIDSATRAEVRPARSTIGKNRALFDDLNASFFGFTTDALSAQQALGVHAVP